ncbi:hypothetical protein D3C77_300240 [compost metagenome]
MISKGGVVAIIMDSSSPNANRKEERSSTKKRYALRQLSFFSALVTLFSSSAVGVFSYLDKASVENFFANGLGVSSLLVALVGMCAIVFMIGLSSEEANINDAEKTASVQAPGRILVRDRDGKIVPAGNLVKKDSEGINKSPLKGAAREGFEGHLESRPYLDIPFESYVNAIVKALDNRISLSEIKANSLLQQGKSLMKWGLGLYAVTVAGWQIASHYWGYSHTLVAGMVSCSLMFVVVEFMAAWFLKQYRSYIDSSMAYLQVRSVYNNYLLTYYAVNQLHALPENRDLVVKMLSEEIKWPALSELSKNDFNYMVESFSGFSTLVEKLKISFNQNTPKPVEGVKTAPQG